MPHAGPIAIPKGTLLNYGRYKVDMELNRKRLRHWPVVDAPLTACRALTGAHTATSFHLALTFLRI